MRFAFKPELERVEGTREYFYRELHALGKLTAPEKYLLAAYWPGFGMA